MSVRVAAEAGDSLTLTGIVRLLRDSGEVLILPPPQHFLADVRVVACDDPATLARTSPAPVVLIAARFGETELAPAVRAGVVAVLRRAEAGADRLLAQVRLAEARGGGLPDRIAETLLRDALTPGRAPVTPRERDVLRLMAEGLGNAEIAAELASTESGVKKTAHRIFHRHRLRNRPHAVAYAMRSGLI
jgi:DNA-binding NarL/FixJ family response regulator